MENKKEPWIVRLYRNGYEYYRNNPLDLAALIISLLALLGSCAGVIIVLISMRGN